MRDKLMEKKKFIGPGTAGVSVRISKKNKNFNKRFSILKLNNISPCSHNQY